MSAPLLDNPSHRLIPSHYLNSRDAARASTFPLSLHDLPNLSHWCEWARKEIRHILGFVAHTAEWSLIMKSADDDWEELRLSTFCDASFGTRCFGGKNVMLTGSRGSSFLIAEHEFDRVRVDRTGTGSQSDAASQKSSGCMSFETSSLRWLLTSLPPVNTTENEGDIMMKVLSAMRHRERCKTDFDLDGGARGEHHDSHSSMSTHWMEESGHNHPMLKVVGGSNNIYEPRPSCLYCTRQCPNEGFAQSSWAHGSNTFS